MQIFPPIESYDAGWLEVGDDHRIHWSVSGNPTGKAALVLHGGPGSGSSTGLRRVFDPRRYRIVQFDQRNCGYSTPYAGDDDVDLSANSTSHLISDCECIRHHLGIDRWLVWGGSWGSTLALAYAQAHPAHVSEMILVSVVTTSRREVDWVTRQMGRLLPAEWAAFRDAVPVEERGDELAAAYFRLLQSSDPIVRERAAAAWCAWEDVHPSTIPGYRHDQRFDDPRFRLCFARLVTHYWSNVGFLLEGQLLENINRITDIPAVLIHGKLDISSPVDVAWTLTRQWPAAELVVIDDAGHGAGHPSTLSAIVAATERFADGASTHTSGRV